MEKRTAQCCAVYDKEMTGAIFVSHLRVWQMILIHARLFLVHLNMRMTFSSITPLILSVLLDPFPDKYDQSI